MNLAKSFLSLSVALGCLIAISVPASAHSAFKKRLAAKYPNMKVSCNACHVQKQPKTERNKYGMLISRTLDNKTLTADWKTKKGAEKKEFEANVMAPAFDKAFEKVKAMTVHDLIEAGIIEGITKPEGEEASSSTTKQ